MDRRRFIAVGVQAVLYGLVARTTAAHTPYRQWLVYRQRHLLVLTSKADSRSFALGKAVAETLADHLPESRARASRASDGARLASLLSTKQMDLAVMNQADAAALLEGRGAFSAYGPLPLRALYAFDDYLLVCRDDFPAAHAFLVVQALDRNRAALPAANPRVPEAPTGAVPLHAGVAAYLDGRPRGP
jgi:TRAP-type uncharacterized transport system substrate-binding protein